MTLLTVLLPTIGRRTLSRAISSVEAQTVPCNLLVIWDVDYSGPGTTLNRGLSHVDTPWVSTFADDDTLKPNFAELLATTVQADTWLSDEPDMVVFQMRYPEGNVLPTTTDPDGLCFGGVGCSYAVKTAMAREIGWVEGPAPTAEDWPMIEAVRSLGKVRIVPEVVYNVRH